MVEHAELPVLHPIKEGYRSPIPPATFLKLALISNPMAYVAINIRHLQRAGDDRTHGFVTHAVAGFVCSIWLFARRGRLCRALVVAGMALPISLFGWRLT